LLLALEQAADPSARTILPGQPGVPDFLRSFLNHP
jgi:hypothetical protein